jgi:hypothetical protein
MAENGSKLQFDRADYGGGASPGPPCALCKGSLRPEYWRWLGLTFCTECRPKMAARIAASQSPRAFAMAAVQGAGVALACGVGYAVFVGVTKMQLALVTIGIAYLVARVVRKASGGVGGTRFQLLAVALTYVGSTMGYAPALFEAMRDTSSEHVTAAEAEGSSHSGGAADATHTGEAADTAHAAADPATPVPARARAERPGFGELAYAFAFLFGIMLAAPFLEITTAPLGALIVFFGLWQAWKLTRAVPGIEGPYRVEPAAVP